MKKSFYLLCFSVLLLPSLAMATDGTGHIHKGPNAAVKKYIKEQIMPVLLQKRQQFDRELSTNERTDIAECRATLKQLRSQHHDYHNWKGNGDNYPAPDYNNANGQKSSNPDFEQRKAVMQRLQAIADRHSNSLQDIKTQLEPARKQWMDDIKKLQPVANDAKSDNNFYGQKHLERGQAAFLYSRHFAAVHFLLLSANAEDQPQGELKSDFTETTPAPAAPDVTLTSFQIMPNPANNDVQLGADILPATNTLKVIDLRGKEVLTLENVQASQHLDVSQLAGGTYLIQIKSGDQVVSKKLIVSK